jgi:hypothetical protein
MKIIYRQTDDDEEQDVFRSGPMGWLRWIKDRIDGLGLSIETITVRHLRKTAGGFHLYEVTQVGTPDQVVELLKSFPADSKIEVR